MGQLIDVPALVRSSFSKMTGYYNGLAGFFQDPAASLGDFADSAKDIDLTGLRQAIQARVKGQASTTNTALISTYRDLDSMQAEQAMRSMTRADYYREGAAEAGVQASSWQSEMNNRLYNLTGVRQAPQG